MGQDALTPSECMERQEQRVREQLNEGCRLARELDERMRSIPTGKLCLMTSDQSDAAASSSDPTTQLRCNIAIATADVVAAFNKAVQLLLQNSYSTWDQSTASSPVLQTALQSSPQQKAATNSCLPSMKPINLAAAQSKSPPLSPAGKHLTAPFARHRAAHNKQQSNMPSASASPSPPGMIHSPLQLSATSEMSDGSPKPDFASPDEATTTSNPIKAAEICRKRKSQPKVALKMPAGSSETAEGNTPPDDGHTWRKYGQKNILGSQYPRSYYRCTHKTDTGCSALKQVQRCDEDDAFFDVVYKGYHTCRSAEVDKECWPLAFPQGLSTFLHFPNRSSSLIPPAAASLMLANMSAAKQTSPTGVLQLSHRASQENFMAHQLCHVVSVPSSDALPLSSNADLSVSQAFPTTDNNVPVMNRALQPYPLNSGQELLAMTNTTTGGSDHLHPLFSNSAAAIQDGSSSRDQLNSIARGTGKEGGHVYIEKGAYMNYQYAHEEQRADYPLQVWPEFENNNEETYKRLAAHYHDARRLPHPFGSLLLQAKPDMAPVTGQEAVICPPPPNCGSLQEQDDVAHSALAFGSMDNDDLLDYLEP